MTAFGLAAGILRSMGTSILIPNLLFGVQALDATILSAVAVLLALCSLFASFLPHAVLLLSIQWKPYEVSDTAKLSR